MRLKWKEKSAINYMNTYEHILVPLSCDGPSWNQTLARGTVGMVKGRQAVSSKLECVDSNTEMETVW